MILKTKLHKTPDSSDSEVKTPDRLRSHPIEGIYSPSALTVLNECERKFQLRYYLNLIPKVKEENEALSFGTAIHHAFDRLSKGENSTAVMEWFIETFQGSFEVEGKRSIRTALGLISCWYNEVRPFEQGKITHSEVDLGAEIQVSGLPSFLIIGRIDRVMEISGEVYIRDWKTTTVYGPDYWTQYDLNDQINAYLVGYELLTGVRPRGMYIDVLRVLANNPPKEGGLIISRAFHRTPEELENWKIITALKISDINRKEEDSFGVELTDPCSPFYPRYSSCIWRYGRPCEYHILCRNWRKDIVQRYIESNYKNEKVIDNPE